ncbi:MAG TPA: CPBP family glutamic-type intramembrane protease [Spirochaetia bacterium]|nr:CPBP family glutamic-type intramembrane protease [Spirochaetia bacterium]
MSTTRTLPLDHRHGLIPIALLPSRLVLFAAFQMLFALTVWARTGAINLQGAGIYWPFAATGANVVTVLILWLVFRQEGGRLVDLYRFTKGSVGRDVLIAIAFFIVAAPVSMLPNIVLGNALFGSVDAVTPLMFPSLPRALAWLAISFPLTIAFAELPLYMGYILPRLAARMKSRIWAVLIVSVFLALQHCTLPLRFDASFLLWRFGMFLPLALLMGFALNWRPRLLPYLMIGHALLDLSTVVMLIGAAT